jgi:hypothetical protein
VVLDGVRADEQLASDLAVGVTTCREARHLGFLRGQLVESADRAKAFEDFAAVLTQAGAVKLPWAW